MVFAYRELAYNGASYIPESMKQIDNPLENPKLGLLAP
jgi:hypothetical protein